MLIYHHYRLRLFDTQNTSCHPQVTKLATHGIKNDGVQSYLPILSLYRGGRWCSVL